MKRIYQSSFFLLLSLSFAVFWFCPFLRAEENHEHNHEHGQECTVCDHSEHGHGLHNHPAHDSTRHASDTAHEHHVDHEHHGHHEHKHSGPAKCPVCGHDHDESEHNKELVMIKYETLDGKEESLYQRAAAMLALAVILGGINFFFKTK